MLRENVAHLSGSVHRRVGRGVKRQHFAAWPTKTGWVVMLDRWIPVDPDGKAHVRSVETRTFDNRDDALRTLWAQS